MDASDEKDCDVIGWWNAFCSPPSTEVEADPCWVWHDGWCSVSGVAGGCTYQEFGCSDGLCIPRSWQCDGFPDCPDGFDETPQICRESKSPQCNQSPSGQASTTSPQNMEPFLACSGIIS